MEKPVVLVKCDKHPTMQYNAEHYCPRCLDERLVFYTQDTIFKDPPKITDFMDEFVKVLTEHLKDKEKHWGDTWVKRSGKLLDTRLAAHLMDKCERSLNGDITIDWLSVVGDAMIGWIRKTHPEIGTK